MTAPTDIMDSLALIRVSFLKNRLRPPTTLLLESHEEGMRFLSSIRQQALWTAIAGSGELGEPVETADGSVWMQVTVMGIHVRWPANRLAARDGSWSYV